MNNTRRPTMRTMSPEAPNPILNHGMEVPIHEYWSFYDFTEWTGKSIGDIMQAVMFGLCRCKDAKTITKIFEAGGLTVREGRKKPIP